MGISAGEAQKDPGDGQKWPRRAVIGLVFFDITVTAPQLHEPDVIAIL